MIDSPPGRRIGERIGDGLKLYEVRRGENRQRRLALIMAFVPSDKCLRILDLLCDTENQTIHIRNRLPAHPLQRADNEFPLEELWRWQTLCLGIENSQPKAILQPGIPLGQLLCREVERKLAEKFHDRIDDDSRRAALNFIQKATVCLLSRIPMKGKGQGKHISVYDNHMRPRCVCIKSSKGTPKSTPAILARISSANTRA